MARNDDNTGTLALLGLAGLVYWLWKTGKLGGTTPPPGEQCPTGQHWDATVGVCVADTPGDGGNTITLPSGAQMSGLVSGLGYGDTPLPTFIGNRLYDGAKGQSRFFWTSPATAQLDWLIRIEGTTCQAHNYRTLGPSSVPYSQVVYWACSGYPCAGKNQPYPVTVAIIDQATGQQLYSALAGTVTFV
ncbi:MAG: hypothetical protein M0Z94_08365 [Dehalococcoidales bacterium]|nr:hypothetical protein [Dehalococcoidales bacterium]